MTDARIKAQMAGEQKGRQIVFGGGLTIRVLCDILKHSFLSKEQ
jgi:hypothetical protein